MSNVIVRSKYSTNFAPKIHINLAAAIRSDCLAHYYCYSFGFGLLVPRIRFSVAFGGGGSLGHSVCSDTVTIVFLFFFSLSLDVCAVCVCLMASTGFAADNKLAKLTFLACCAFLTFSRSTHTRKANAQPLKNWLRQKKKSYFHFWSA